MFDFVDISFIDVLDILMVGLLVYWLIRAVRGTSAVNIFIGILLIYVVWIVSRAVGMKLLSFILGQILGVGVVALLVIFQPEIRRFLLRITSSTTAARKGVFNKLFRQAAQSAGMRPIDLEELTAACRKMSETKTGALIVIRHGSSLNEFIDTGDEIDARINRRLIENIFFKNTPLHDGAMIISTDHIIAARCTLPITARQDIPAHYGMRHRAAIGISEVSDASVIVVSEETGDISFVQDGIIKTMGSITELRLAIENSYK